MKKTWKILAFILALTMLFSLAGCSSFESKMAKAVKKMGQLQSVHMDMDMHMELSMSMLGQSLDMDMSMTSAMDLQSEPMRSRIEMTTNLMDMNQQMLMYLEQSGEEYTVYLSLDEGASWEKQTMTAEEVPAQSGNLDQNLKMFVDCAKSFEEAGKESVNGSSATRYDGEISGESIQTALELSGAKEMLGESLGTELDEDAFTDLGGIPCSVWIDDKSGMVVRYDMDMTAIMQSLMEDMIDEVLSSQGLEGIEMKLDFKEITASAVLSQFDQIGEIVIPDAAKAA